MNEQINKEKVKNLTALLGFFAWMFLGSTFFVIPIIIIGSQKSGLSLIEYSKDMDLINLHAYFASSISQILAIIVFAIIFKKIVIDDAIAFKNNLLKYIIVIIVSSFIMYFGTELIALIYEKIGLGDQTSQNQEGIVTALMGEQSYIVVFYTVILAPIIEEIIFRKLFYNVLKQYTKIPVWGIVLLISVVFAFIHVTDVESMKFFPVYFFPTLIITSAYAFTKENIYVSIGLHGINNLVSVLEILL